MSNPSRYIIRQYRGNSTGRTPGENDTLFEKTQTRWKYMSLYRLFNSVSVEMSPVNPEETIKSDLFENMNY